MNFLESVRYEAPNTDKPKIRRASEILSKDNAASRVLLAIEDYAKRNKTTFSAEGFEHGVHAFTLGDEKVYFRMGIAHGGTGYCSVKASEVNSFGWWKYVLDSVMTQGHLQIEDDI